MPTRELYFNDIQYDAREWAAIFGSAFRDGVIPNYEDRLKVAEGNPPAMEVRVLPGAGFAAGRFFELYNETLVLPLDAADGSNPRVDRVVIRVDIAAKTISLAVLTGTPGSEPDPPAVQRDSSRHEVSLAKVNVGTGVDHVDNNNIDDERSDYSVGGWCGANAGDPGEIKMHSTAYAPIPPGWALCDGTNGTPDLSDKFVLGSGGSRTVGTTGGTETETLTEGQIPGHTHSQGNTGSDNHTHSGTTESDSHSHGDGSLATSSAGGHDHQIRTSGTNSDNHNHLSTDLGETSVGGKSDPQHDEWYQDAPVVSNGAHTHTISGSTASDLHTHGFTTGSDSHAHTNPATNSTGGGNPHNNMPPFYVLAFIMKLK